MNDRLKAMIELEKRGKLPEQYSAALAEARRRGLVPSDAPAQSEEKGWGQTIRENVFGDDDPTTQNFGEAVGSFLNKSGESMTMGLVGDEASAALESLMPGVDYEDRRDHYRQQERQFEQDHPGLALTADIGGAMVAPVGAFGAVGKGASLAKRIGASAGATGALSGMYGFMEGEGGAKERAKDAGQDFATGAAVGATIPVVGAGVQKLANSRATKKAISRAVKDAPSTDELRSIGRQLYDDVDRAGVRVRSDKTRAAMGDIAQALRHEGLGLKSADRVLPRSAAVLDNVDEFGRGANSVRFKDLDMLRRFSGNAAANSIKEPADARLATMAQSKIDDFVSGLGPGDIDAGDIDALQSALPKAREVWARMSKSQIVDDAIESADNYLSGGTSGLRNQFARILRNDKLKRKFTTAERRAMQRVAQGSLPEQLLHLMAGGVGNIAAMTGGAAMGGLPGFAAGGALSYGLRKASKKIADRNAEVARALVASGKAPQLPVQASPRTRAIIEQLLRQGTAAVQN